MLFRKECLVSEFKEIIESAKDGMEQIMDMRNELKKSSK